MTTTDQRRSKHVTLELQAKVRDHALADRVDRLERVVARVHARIDGALVTIVPAAHIRGEAGPPRD
jgi:hypothetical protein